MWLPNQTRCLKEVLAVLLLSLFMCIVAPSTYAAEFSNVLIRPDRTKAGTSPGAILIQARVGEVVTEDALRITLGSAWSGSSSAGAYTISTSSLPAGTTAWPGIGTATSVSGQQVTFPSGDLSSGTLYGFYLTGGIATNPASPGDSAGYLWSLATLAGGNPASQSEAMVAILANDQISISATIEPPSSDYSATISTTDDSTELPQDSTITYTVTYGSEYDFATPVTVQAEWSLGTVSGSGSPSVELLEYVPGSASTAYGGTSPIINLTNRTITWTIASFPGNTIGETVSFQLKTTDSYTGSNTVTADVAARIINPVSTPDSTSSVSYVYEAPVIPSPTPSPTPTPSSSSSSSSTATPTPSAAAVATPSPTPSPSPQVFIVSYSVQEVLDTSITLSVELNTDSPITVQYGRSPETLTQTQTSAASTSHTIRITDLLPNTSYYLRITLPQADGTQTQSEHLQFTTAQTGVFPVPTILTLSSRGSHLWTGTVTTEQPFLIPSGQPIELALQFEQDTLVESILLHDSSADGVTYLSSLIRTQPGIWSSRVQLPSHTMPLHLVVVIRTSSGALQHIPIFAFRVALPLQVKDAISGNALERARILLEIKDPVTNLYRQLAAPAYLADNPIFSAADGSMHVVLPPGVYRAEISAIGFDSQTVEFSTLTEDAFPQVELQQSGNAVLNTIAYHSETVGLKLQQLITTLKTEAQSSATVELVSLWTIAVSAPLSLAGLLAQAHFSIATLFGSVLHHSRFLLGKGLGKTLFIPGSVVDTQSNRPVQNAVISLIDTDGKTKIMLQAHRDGSFAIPATILQTANALLAMAPGFAPQSLTLDRTLTSITVALSEDTTTGWIRVGTSFIKRVLITAFELNLAVSLALGVAFTFVYDSSAAVPFLVMSAVNTVIFALSRLSAFLHAIHFK